MRWNSCVSRYLEVAPKGTKMREAKTLFLHDEGNHGPSRDPTKTKGPRCVWCDYITPVEGQDAEPTVGGDGAPSVSPNGDDEVRGQLADAAASVLMKVLYAARKARFDLLRPVQGLAKWFTKWKKRHDDELYRLVCYIHTTKGKKLIGWVADDIDDIQPHVFSDSDFAGTEGTQTSASGVHLCLRGPHISSPLSGQSKRQGCVSLSTTEAELMAGALALKSAGFPVIIIMQILTAASNLRGNAATVLHFHVDNQAMAAVIRSGRNPTMRHLSRTHGISFRGCMNNAEEKKFS